MFTCIKTEFPLKKQKSHAKIKKIIHMIDQSDGRLDYTFFMKYQWAAFQKYHEETKNVLYFMQGLEI